MPQPKDKNNIPIRSKKVKAFDLAVVDPMRAGIDIGSKFHCVCAPHRSEAPEVRTFGTTTRQLRLLVDWLKERGVTSVAMESTSVYWIALFEMLESAGLNPLLANARQLNKVPGRKTDVEDCQWIQKLHCCGFLRGSFRPNAATVALRSLARQSANLVQEQSQTVQWMQKALDQMNIQVHRAVTDITGTTGLAITRAIVAGVRNPLALAQMRDCRCKKDVEQMAEYLEGTWQLEHLFNLKQALAHYDFLESQIEQYQVEIDQRFRAMIPPERMHQSAPPPAKASKAKSSSQNPQTRTLLWQATGVDLTTIDGIGTGTAQVILSEIGPRLDAFATEGDLVSWLHLCPKSAISGGKVLTKKGNSLGANRVGHLLRLAAVSLTQSKSALGAQYRRKARAKSGKIAIFATARKLAILVYRLLRYGQAYVDLGQDVQEALYKQKHLKSLQQQAHQFGCQLVPLATG